MPVDSAQAYLGSMSEVRAVVFDFGGVLITSIANQVGEVAHRHGVPTATMLEVLLGPHESGDHPWHRAERGEISVSEIQDHLQQWADPHGIDLAGDELEVVLRPGGYRVIEPMVDKVAELRGSGLRTGLLTNTFAEFRPTMERDLRFGDFTVVVESFAVGSRKPERANYAAAQGALDVAHDEILYLDDFAQNIDMAAALGWSTIHVTDPLTAIDEIDAMLAARRRP
jgi:putative hydrolase of the HAD superfamily